MYITRRLFGKTNSEQIYMSMLTDDEPELPGAESTFLYGTSTTATERVDVAPKELAMMFDAEAAEEELKSILAQAQTLTGHDWYKHYAIAKRDGGVRRIDDPCDQLRQIHLRIQQVLERRFFALYHNAAYAYVRHRSTYQCVGRHQRSSWFMKTDFKNFFGSTTPECVMNALEMIWPFSEFCRSDERKALLQQVLGYAFLNNGLPQGSTLSPMFTNLIMIPFDHEFTEKLKRRGFVYTRYADDCLISSCFSFSMDGIKRLMFATLRSLGYPYRMNYKKTRYGSIKGKNWNLGYMLNADHQITIGHQAKRYLKADMYNFFRKWQYDRPSLTLEWLQAFDGRVNYYRYAEPDYVKQVINRTKAKLRLWWYDYDRLMETAIRIVSHSY